MSELLICLIVITLFFPMMIRLMQVLSSVNRFPIEIQDQIGLAQLRRFFTSCRITNVNEHEIVCENDRQWHLKCSDHHLFLSDGTIIVLADVNEVVFEERGNQVWMYYCRNNQWKEALIAYE